MIHVFFFPCSISSGHMYAAMFNKIYDIVFVMMS